MKVASDLLNEVVNFRVSLDCTSLAVFASSRVVHRPSLGRLKYRILHRAPSSAGDRQWKPGLFFLSVGSKCCQRYLLSHPCPPALRARTWLREVNSWLSLCLHCKVALFLEEKWPVY